MYLSKTAAVETQMCIRDRFRYRLCKQCRLIVSTRFLSFAAHRNSCQQVKICGSDVVSLKGIRKQSAQWAKMSRLMLEFQIPYGGLDTSFIKPGRIYPVSYTHLGNVLRDLIDSGCIPTVELKQVFRQAAESRIVTNAHRIVAGEYPDLTVRDNDFFFLRRQNAASVLSTVTELVAKRLPASYGYSPLEDIQVLTPQRKGDLGVYSINDSLQQALNPPEKGKKEYKSTFFTFREGDKVLQTRNNYDIEWEKPGTREKGWAPGAL